MRKLVEGVKKVAKKIGKGYIKRAIKSNAYQASRKTFREGAKIARETIPDAVPAIRQAARNIRSQRIRDLAKQAAKKHAKIAIIGGLVAGTAATIAVRNRRKKKKQ
jgi:NADPH-dependent 2,4-dienoyl-CoA reductase/sulfur reductase-like enzyme